MAKCIMSVAVKDSIRDAMKHLSISTRISVSQIAELMMIDFLGGYDVSNEAVKRLNKKYDEVIRNDN